MSEAMFEALEDSTVDQVRELVSRGERIDATYKATGLSALLLVASTSSGALLDALLDLGANLEDRDRLGNNVLMRAAHAGNEAGVRWALRRGVRLDVGDHVGNTALHLAVKERHAGAVRLLLAAGAPTGVKNAGGQTPRDMASALGDRGILAILDG